MGFELHGGPNWLEMVRVNSAHQGGETRLELGVHRFWNYVELFWNSLDNAPSSIIFYLEMKVEVGVHDIRSRFTPRRTPCLARTRPAHTVRFDYVNKDSLLF